MGSLEGDDDGVVSAPSDNKNRVLSGKIMMCAMIILFIVIVLMVCLHLYARWYVLRARRRSLRSSRRRQLVFYVDDAGHTVSVPTQGLDTAVLKSLPVFVYSEETHPDPIECAVCLSEFEENETGRILPKCSHSFHIECIDMWFHSHSTCPLCRSPVESESVRENPDEVVVSVGTDEPEREEPGSSNGLCSECEHEEYKTGKSLPSSSFGGRRKCLEMEGVSIEVPCRNESFGRFENDSGVETPSSQAFRSPVSRMMSSMSFRRIMSSNRRGGVSPSGNSVSYSSVNESDIERGRDGTQ